MLSAPSIQPTLGVGGLLPPADAHVPPQAGPLPEWPTLRPLPRPSQWEEATAYRPSRELWQALELAIFLGEPLLVTGEPGCGKTQLAFYAARRLGLGPGMQRLILKRFLQIRALEQRKKPATAELLRWASALASLAGVDERMLEALELSALPFRELLLKTREDVEEVQGVRTQ